jgi:hypothetical protein
LAEYSTQRQSTLNFRRTFSQITTTNGSDTCSVSSLSEHLYRIGGCDLVF